MKALLPGLVAPRWGDSAALCDLSTPSTGCTAASVRVRRSCYAIGGFSVISVSFLWFSLLLRSGSAITSVICHPGGPGAASSASGLAHILEANCYRRSAPFKLGQHSSPSVFHLWLHMRLCTGSSGSRSIGPDGPDADSSSSQERLLLGTN